MSLFQAQKLLSAQEKGTELTTEERRHCVAFLIATEGQTNEELAERFGVHPRTITNDRKAIREDVATELKSEDIALVIADIRMAFEQTMRNIDMSAKVAKKGTQVYLNHQSARFKLQMDYIKGMQDLGIYPKELGTMHVEEFKFEAILGKNNQVETRAVNMFDKPTAVNAEFVTNEPKALTSGENSIESGKSSSPEEVNSSGAPGQASPAAPPASS